MKTKANLRSAVKHLPMVGWYDPRQLVKTGFQVAISTIFGRHADFRVIEALSTGQSPVFDYTYFYRDDGDQLCEPDLTRPRRAIWIDYVNGVGDGWNSTYAIAQRLAEDGLTLCYTDPQSGTSEEAQTHRGNLLIFGGDQVYPTANRQNYQQRLLAPYEMACCSRACLQTHKL